jgi:CubicO group peptidase (beta-lactamase class C family)
VVNPNRNNQIEIVEQVFRSQIRTGIHPGAQLVVRNNGEYLFDQSAGYTNNQKNLPITPDTIFLTFSLTKPYTSACIFKLIDQNQLNLGDKIGDFWPEFSCSGKEEMTIKQVLLHQSGLPKTRLIYQIINSPNWKKIITDLEKQKPDFPPGTKTAYQLLNYGFILGEVIERVSGLPVDKFLNENFLDPLGLTHTYMRITDFQRDQFAPLSSATLDHQFVAWIFNRNRMRGSLLPAASLHSTAREMSIFFQMLLNGGEFEGQRYLNTETVEQMISLGFEGYDESLGRKIRWGYGFFLGGDHILHPEYADGMGKGSSLDTFGHYGQRNSMVWADRRTGTVVVFLCNRFLSSDKNKLRLQQISNVIWDVIDK